MIVCMKILAILFFSYHCFGHNGGMIPLTQINQENHHKAPDALSSKDLESIYDVAKNVSHSKGSILKSKEGKFEYRRSFTSRVELEVNSLRLQNIISAIRDNVTRHSFNKSLLLDNLDFLEILVHQYDIGKKFVDLHGFKLILSLTENKDDDISNAAFIILSAAMQGNLDVQKYASKTDLMKIITTTLNSNLEARINGALLTLSAFTRNCPEALFDFLNNDGLNTLSILLTHYFNVTKIQLRIINILSDVATEIWNENAENLSTLTSSLRKNFIKSIHLFSICDRIINMLYFSKEYIALEKIVASVKTMFHICKKTFVERNLVLEVKALMDFYNPYKPPKNWYAFTMDRELKYYLFQDLKYVYEKLSSEIDISLNPKTLKLEL